MTYTRAYITAGYSAAAAAAAAAATAASLPSQACAGLPMALFIFLCWQDALQT